MKKEKKRKVADKKKRAEEKTKKEKEILGFQCFFCFDKKMK